MVAPGNRADLRADLPKHAATCRPPFGSLRCSPARHCCVRHHPALPCSRPAPSQRCSRSDRSSLARRASRSAAKMPAACGWRSAAGASSGAALARG
eukprot:6205000-Prymnesium_polylepis.2